MAIEDPAVQENFIGISLMARPSTQETSMPSPSTTMEPAETTVIPVNTGLRTDQIVGIVLGVIVVIVLVGILTIVVIILS